MRHRGNHYNSVVFKNQKFPLNQSKGFHLKNFIRDSRDSSVGFSRNISKRNAPLPLPKTEDFLTATRSPLLENNMMVCEPFISTPTKPQVAKINEHMEISRSLYETEEASNEGKSMTMDWNDQSSSYGNILGKKCGLNPRYEHNNGEAKLVYEVDDNDMRRGEECDSTAVAVLKNPSPPKKKLRTNTLLDFVKVMPKAPDGFAKKLFARESKNQGDTIIGVSSRRVTEGPTDTRNIFCPIPGCGNWGGRGFRRSRVSKHLMGQHPADLLKNSPNYAMISTFLEPLERKICVACNRIFMRCTEKGFCESCDKSRPVARQIARDLTEIQRKNYIVALKSIQKTKFMLRRSVPRKLCTLWSDLLTDIAMGMADASKESEAWRALKRYLMVKAVLIQPVRGGGGQRNRNINLTQKLMAAFFKGKEDKCGADLHGNRE